MFFVPGLIPQEANESEGNRGLSQSERDCGVGKLELVRGMVESLRKRRCLGGKERELKDWWDLGEEKRRRREREVRRMSGKVGGLDIKGLLLPLMGGGGDMLRGRDGGSVVERRRLMGGG